jgi:sugar/nucleoside kinase (ribokinase family)
MSDASTKRFDVVGLGCAAVDDFIYVPSYPPVDRKLRVSRTQRKCGGLTGAALVAAARLGARCAYAGCLGPDELSQHVANDFKNEGVDISLSPRIADARVVHSTIVVGEDNGSRNIFFEDSGIIGAHDTLPDEKVIRQCKVLIIDHLGMQGNHRAAHIARDAGVAVLADFEFNTSPLFPEVLALVDHLVLSEDFALRISHQANAADAAQSLWKSNRAAVIVTSGRAGCWSVASDQGHRPRHQPAFEVSAADTTGCGDVFHGAYAASLALGEPLDERIRFASAAAALKAMHGETPRLADVKDFLNSRPH